MKGKKKEENKKIYDRFALHVLFHLASHIPSAIEYCIDPGT